MKRTFVGTVDLTGFKSDNSSLTVLKDSKERTIKGEILWNVSCECGREALIATNVLKRGQKTCGKCKKAERDRLKGKRYEFLLKTSGRRSFLDVRDDEAYKIIKGYLEGVGIKELEELFKINKTTLHKQLVQLNNNLSVCLALDSKIQEVQLMDSAPVKIDVDALVRKSLDIPALEEVLSEPYDELTPEELKFCWVLVNTGSYSTALVESGLSSLISSNGSKILLEPYLLNKSNIKACMKQLTVDRELDLDVTKNTVQGELVTQIYQLKEKLATTTDSRGGDRGYLLKAIELLGKSIGAFQDRVTVEQVDVGKAMDSLINMAKEEITSTYTIEDVS